MPAPSKTVVIERMYWLPYCSTCVKAEQFLLDKGAKVQKHINVKEEPVSRAELEELSHALGGVENLFSKRAMKYRAWGLHEKTLNDEDMLKYMQEEYTFIKRPVIVTSDGKVLSGFSAKQYALLFA
ncbi:MAG TPA: arsenate reductase family protein [Coleofasciculaceae cyanobacterium]|jgi:arsenate reductase